MWLTTTRLQAADPTTIFDTIRDVTTGGALAISGDIIAQSLAARGAQDPDDTQASLAFPPANWDATRTLALGTFGALYTGGAQHFIFGFLNGSLSDPVQRLVLAQFCFIPFLYYPTYLLVVPALRTLPLDEQVATVERERLQTQVLQRLPATLVRNWSFWLPVQFVQFSFIPPDMHVTYCAAFGVIWNAILSWSTMQESPPQIPAGLQSTSGTSSDDNNNNNNNEAVVVVTNNNLANEPNTPAATAGSNK